MFTEGSENLRLLVGALGSRGVTEIRSLSGSALAVYAAAAVKESGGVHVFISEDKDTAAYLMNDFYALLGEEGVMFFPAGYKRSVQFGQEDASGIVQRTAALNAIRNFRETEDGADKNGAAGKKNSACLVGKNGNANKNAEALKEGGGNSEAGKNPQASNNPEVGKNPPYLIICTYPEALAEKVIDADRMEKHSLGIKAGSRLSMEFLAEALDEYGFTRVDFVHEPGQYSRRGGITSLTA